MSAPPHKELAERKGRPIGIPSQPRQWEQIAPNVWIPESGPVSIQRLNPTLQQMTEGKETFTVTVKCKSFEDAKDIAELALAYSMGE